MIHTNNYLDAVVNPLEHTTPTKLPDGINDPTIPMVDYYAASLINVDVGAYAAAPANSIGALVFISYSVRKNSYTNQGGNFPYRLLVMPVDSNLNPILYFGVNTIPSVAYNNANQVANLSKSLRLLAGGIRLTPVTEVVTNVAAQYITKYYGACVASTDIYLYQTGGTTLLSMFEASRFFQEYSNNQGICTRFDPLQYSTQRKFYTAQELGDPEIVNFDKWYNSVIYVEFSQAIAPVLAAGKYSYTYPVRIYSKLFLESQLAYPTPIISDNGWLDLKLEETIAVTRASDIYPCICSGHTFKSFLSNIKPLHRMATSMLNIASDIVPMVKPVAKANQILYDAYSTSKKSPAPSVTKMNNTKSKKTNFRPVQQANKAGKKRKNKKSGK